MPPEPFVSLAKAPSAKRSEIGYGKENEIIILLLSPHATETANTLVRSLEAKTNFALSNFVCSINKLFKRIGTSPETIEVL